MSNYISIIILLAAALLSFSCSTKDEGAVSDDFQIRHDYINEKHVVFKQGKVFWELYADPAKFSIFKLKKKFLIFVMEFEFNFEVGDTVIWVFDRQTESIVVKKDLLSIKKIGQTENEIRFIEYTNKYGFLEPIAPMWPRILVVEGGKIFYEDAELSILRDLSREAKKFSELIRQVLCDNKLEDCFYQEEYEKNLRLLKDIEILINKRNSDYRSG